MSDEDKEVKRLCSGAIRHLLSTLAKAAASSAAFAVIFTCVFGAATLERNDMFPCIYAGDQVVYIRIGSIGKQDAVVYESDGGQAAGRIIAMEGDTVDVTSSGQLTINGNIQPVQKRIGLFEDTYEKEGCIEYPVTPGKGEYFILGDNREDAKDSRVYGCIAKKDIRGVIFLLIRRRAV